MSPCKRSAVEWSGPQRCLAGVLEKDTYCRSAGMSLKGKLLKCPFVVKTRSLLLFWNDADFYLKFFKTAQTLFTFQLSSTKSMDGQLTLVHFLEDVIETKYPEISGFENELTHVEQAARGTVKCHVCYVTQSNIQIIFSVSILG